MSKRGRHSLRTYLRLTFALVILIGENFVFNKLFDLLYGKDNVGYAIGIAIDIFVFIAFFTIFLWLTDGRGTLARLMGARDDDELIRGSR